MDIQQIYTDILAFAGKKVDDQGQVHALVNEDKQLHHGQGLTRSLTYGCPTPQWQP
jgi:hypothetical protein